MQHPTIRLKKSSIFKSLNKLIFIGCFVFLLERFIRLQTHGFRIEKVYFDNYIDNQEITQPPDENEILNQEFYFLGSGVQCYVFLGKDQKTVLKLFKHYHAWPSSTLLQKFPLPKSLHSWRENVFKERQKRIKSIYESVFLASQLSENTGVFHIHLKKTYGQYPQIKLFDKIGVLHRLSLDEAAFALQEKAEPLGECLEKYPEKRREILESFLQCVYSRYQQHIINTDSVFFRNFGVCNGKVIEIDIGSFCKNPYLTQPKVIKKELFYETFPLLLWLKKHAKEDSLFFEEQIQKAYEPIQVNSLDELSDNFRSKSNDSLCFILKIWTKVNHLISS